MPVVRSLLVPRKIMLCLLGAGWVAFALSVLVRPHRGEFNVWLDVGLYNLVWVFAVAACAMGARQNDRERWAWVVFSAGLSLYLLGNVYGSLVVGAKGVYPSPADALWLASYGCVYVGIVLLTRARSVRFYASSWLDGAIGGLGLAALAVTCFLGPVLVVMDGDFGIVATNLAYPIAEIVLIILLVSFGSMIPRPRGAAWWMLGAGLAVICVGDAAYLFTRALGLYHEGGFLDVSWPLGAALIGQAALTKAPTRAVKETSRRTWLVYPAGFAAISVGLLVYGQFAPLSKTAAILAAVTLILTIGRMVWNLRETGQLAETRAQARTDDLTRLPNRRAFNEALAEYLSKPAAPLGLLLMDLDRFKEINDSLGHSAGDHLLEMVGARLSGSVRHEDLLARIGGDEFALIVRAPDAHSILAAAERLHEVLDRPFTIDGMELPLGASIGLAMAPEHGTDGEELLARADIAMYRAKRNGTGIEVFDPAKDSGGRVSIEFRSAFHTALESGQLVLHYQPKIDLITHRVVGVEALVHWDRPGHGLVDPKEFLPQTEQAGMVNQLTMAVLPQALRTCREWRDLGYDLTLAINVAQVNLVDAALTEAVLGVLERESVSRDALILEITETSFMSDRERCKRVLGGLHDAGVKISIDGYGTGYTAPAYLRDYPVDEIKLDRSFVTEMNHNRYSRAIISSTIELAHALGLSVVAEGIEDRETFRSLLDLGCDTGQGYYILPPVPADRLFEYLAQCAAGSRRWAFTCPSWRLGPSLP